MKQICFFLIASLALMVLALTDHASAEAPRPNIVLILCDDLGYSDVGFNGSTDIVTPNLDQLATGGTVFTSAYVTHPFCGPSRMGLMSGRYSHEFGGPYNLPGDADCPDGIPVSEVLVSKVLQDAGYYTGAVGKWHMGIAPQFHPNKRGFDDYYGFLGGGHEYFPDEYRPKYQRQIKEGPLNVREYVRPLEHNGKQVEENEYITDALSREASRFVTEASKKDEPFFLYLAYNAPHSPLQAKEEDMAQFPAIENGKRKTYAGMVYAVDRGVGELVETLKLTGELENTLIVFLSDNGGKLSLGGQNSPLREGKGSVFEGGFRVPMFFHWPGHVAAGEKFASPVSSLDFYPTFAGLAGAAIPEGKEIDGKDVWPHVMAGTNPRAGQPIFALRHRLGFSDVAARQDRWKAVRVSQQPWKLFDIDNDMAETNDLAAKHPEVIVDLVGQAKEWSKSHTQPGWYDAPSVEREWKENDMPQYETTFQIE